MTAPTTPPSMTSPPTAPNRNSPATFRVRMDDFLAWLVAWVTELTAAITNVFTNATSAYESATDAAASASSAATSALSASGSAAASAASAGATEWASGSYATGTRKWSPSDQRLYARRAPGGASPTDPASDPTNWAPVQIGLPIDVLTGTTGTVRANVRTRCTNAAAVAVTLPTLADGDVVEIDFDNGRYDNSFNVGSQTIKGPNGSTATGVITHDEGGFLRLYFNGTHIRSAQ